MELKIIGDPGTEVGVVTVPDGLFAREFNEALVHQVVVAYQANARSGNRAQMTRSEVRHSTKKPWRQKGTGRARIGTTASPLWRGGGRAFPNKPDENFSQKINRKMYRAGIASILSRLASEGRLVVVERLDVEAPKTRLLAQKLRSLGVDRALLLTDEISDHLMLAARNLPGFMVIEPRHLDPLSLVYFPQVLITKGALAKLEELFG